MIFRELVFWGGEAERAPERFFARRASSPEQLHLFEMFISLVYARRLPGVGNPKPEPKS